MATFNASTISGILKQVYSKENVMQIQNMETELYARFKKTLKEHSPQGQGWYFAARFQSNQGIKSTGTSSGTLPTAGTAPVQQAKVTPVRHYGAIQIDRMYLDQGANKDAAFAANVLADALDNSFEAFFSDQHRQMYGTGTGVIATISDAINNATHALVDGMYLRVGMVVDIWDSGFAGVKATGLTVNSYDPFTNSVTFSAAYNSAANDVIVRTGITPSTSAPQEITGLPAIIGNAADLTTFEAISRSSFPDWSAQVYNASSGALTLDVIQQMIDRVQIKSGKKPNLLVSRHGQRRKLFELVIPQIRYAEGAGIDAGATDPKVYGYEFLVDRYCNKGTIYGINTDSIEQFVLRDPELAESPEGYQFTRVATLDELQTYIVAYNNLGSVNPAANFKIINLQEPTY